ncbi:MAG: DUF1801 domain-containing protein [Planctomycetota bacterium]|nr:DUF1801 domain-containing protein [Planctomycetota bacterium]
MKTPGVATPDEYVASLDGWRLKLVRSLRKAVRAAGPFKEKLKWGHLVYLHNGPAMLIRAEAERVLYGFWRGQQFLELEPRLKPGGKYDMATLELREGDSISTAAASALAKAAFDCNERLGDPRDAAKPSRKKPVARASRTKPKPR